jgi:hypothetical protein
VAEPTEPATSVVIVADAAGVRLTWEEFVGARRDLPEPPALLDEAYETANDVMHGDPGSISMSVNPDGSLISSGFSKGDVRPDGVVRLSIVGASRDDARAWAECRLGATGWNRVTSDIEVGTLS